MLLDGEDIYAPRVNPMQLRRRVGMVFQKPTPFPTMSIYDNVAAGLRVNNRVGKLRGAELDEVVERALRQRGALGRGEGPAQGERDRAVGRPAAAALHRADHRARSPR